MSEKFDKKKVSPEENQKNPENKLLSQFKNNLSHLASEVKNTSRAAFDKALQSLEKWLLSQKKEVQNQVVDDLNTLRSSVSISKRIEKKWIWSYETNSSDPLSRSLSVNKEILAASTSISLMIKQSDQDTNPIASIIGRWMQKILNTES